MMSLPELFSFHGDCLHMKMKFMQSLLKLLLKRI